MYYGDIRPIDVANGPGVRVSLFVSGCTHGCPGCFNPETWDFHYGSPFGPEQEEEILACLSKPYIKGLSLRFRGSANQRLIHVPASLAQGRVVLWDETP